MSAPKSRPHHQFYDQLLAAIPTLVSRLDREFNYLFVNEGYEKWFGVRREDILGKNMSEVLGKSVVDVVRARLELALAGEAQRFQVEVPYKFRGHRNIDVTYVPLRNSNGDVEELLTLVNDISAQVAAERNYRVLLETMSDGFVRQDASAQILEYNEASLNILGLSADQLMSRTSLDPRWQALRVDWTSFPGETHPAIVALQTGQRVVGTLMGLHLPDGTERWIRINASPFATKVKCKNPLPGVPNDRQVLCTFSDVTELVEIQRENKFTLDTLNIGIWKFNPISQALHWDESMYRLFEVDKKDFSADYLAWESCLTPETKANAVHELQLALKGEKEFNTTFEIKSRGTSRRFIAGRGQVICDADGKPKMMYGVNYDRTAEVEMEKRIEAERLKAIHTAKLASLGEMSAGVAHEINNPLAIISGHVKSISKVRSDDAKFESKLGAISRAVERITKIVKGLKRFSRTSDGTAKCPLALSSVVREATSVFESIAETQGVKISLDLKSDELILCDDVEVEQVIINLLSNAVDAIKQLNDKWIQLKVFDENDFIVLQVMDSGNGINPEIEAKLFEPFFTTKPTGEGTGLGLSISKGILDQHGAQIVVNRKVANTCFEIRFPKLMAKFNAA